MTENNVVDHWEDWTELNALVLKSSEEDWGADHATETHVVSAFNYNGD